MILVWTEIPDNCLIKPLFSVKLQAARDDSATQDLPLNVSVDENSCRLDWLSNLSVEQQGRRDCIYEFGDQVTNFEKIAFSLSSTHLLTHKTAQAMGTGSQ